MNLKASTRQLALQHRLRQGRRRIVVAAMLTALATGFTITTLLRPGPEPVASQPELHTQR